MNDLIKLFEKELQEYKDFLLFCYDNDVINGEEFFFKMNFVNKLENI